MLLRLPLGSRTFVFQLPDGSGIGLDAIMTHSLTDTRR